MQVADKEDIETNGADLVLMGNAGMDVRKMNLAE